MLISKLLQFVINFIRSKGWLITAELVTFLYKHKVYGHPGLQNNGVFSLELNNDPAFQDKEELLPFMADQSIKPHFLKRLKSAQHRDHAFPPQMRKQHLISIVLCLVKTMLAYACKREFTGEKLLAFRHK